MQSLPLLVQYLSVSKNFSSQCIRNHHHWHQHHDLSPCNTPGYLPWTWMCFLPGNRGLLGGVRRLPTSSSPSRLSWIGVPSCWWSLELKQICDAIWRNTFWHLADFANMVVLTVLPLESTWIEFMINYQIWFFYIEEQRSSSRNHIF